MHCHECQDYARRGEPADTDKFLAADDFKEGKERVSVTDLNH